LEGTGVLTEFLKRHGWTLGQLGGRLRERPVAGYGLAVAAAVLALALRLALQVSLPPGFPFLTFFPVIIVTSFVAGRGPGIVCAILSLLAAWFFIIQPVNSFALDASSGIALALSALVAAVEIALIAVMQRAIDRLAIERQLTARLYQQQRELFEELQHRVANNMTFVSSLLRLQQRRIGDDADAASVAFDEAARRIETMASIHRRLYDPAAANLALQAHLQQICDDLLLATGADDRIDCEVALPGLRLGLDLLLPLSLLVAEVVTNSLKHGFSGGASGSIHIGMEAETPGDRILVIRDNGVGLAAPGDQVTSSGLGMRIMHSLAHQIGGHISMASDGGAVIRLHLPA
jgi:two-component sensor histidine kinase